MPISESGKRYLKWSAARGKTPYGEINHEEATTPHFKLKNHSKTSDNQAIITSQSLDQSIRILDRIVKSNPS